MKQLQRLEYGREEPRPNPAPVIISVVIGSSVCMLDFVAMLMPAGFPLGITYTLPLFAISGILAARLDYPDEKGWLGTSISLLGFAGSILAVWINTA